MARASGTAGRSQLALIAELLEDVAETCTLPRTNVAPENRPSQKETIVFQPSIFRCKLLVSGRVVVKVDGDPPPSSVD